MQASWTAVGDQAGGGAWQLVAVGLPLVFLALLGFLVLKAVLRRGRYRAVDVLHDDDRLEIHSSLVEAERKTVGEILPVVVERSDPHPGAD